MSPVEEDAEERTTTGQLVPAGGEHGVTRFAGVVAGGLRQAGGRTVQATADTSSLRSVVAAVRGMRQCDVLHVQHTRDYWGQGWRQVLTVAGLRLARGARPLVVTAHDFHSPVRAWSWSPRAVWRRVRHESTPSDVASLVLLRSADLVLACSRRELDLLAWAAPRRTGVVPHYVEERHGPAAVRASRPSPADGTTRLVVLGWVHRRKGQHWAVRALAHLQDHELVLAGAANARNQHYLDEVLGEARELGVVERTRCTGYLEDHELDELLAGADVGLAPYARIAASGSIATLVAAGVPFVARRTPYLAELAAACPTAVVTYEDDDPEQIAAAVRRCTASDRHQQRLELASWASDHGPLQCGQQHLAQFARVAGPTRGRVRPVRSAKVGSIPAVGHR